jgi:hypothetical protein
VKKGTNRRDFIKAASVVMVATTAAAAAKTRPDAYDVTAERVAVLLESPDTPEPLRGMLCHVVETFGYNLSDAEPVAASPEFARRTLPELLAAAVREGFVYTDIDTVATTFSASPFREGGGR